MKDEQKILLNVFDKELHKLPPFFNKWYVEPKKEYSHYTSVLAPSPLHQTDQLIVERLYKPLSIFI
jgi:hypothetical protein